MENGKITRHQFSTSSYYPHYVCQSPRVFSLGAWCAGDGETEPYYSVSFNNHVMVSALALQARYNTAQMVTKYSLRYGSGIQDLRWYKNGMVIIDSNSFLE